jgi:hypothetical protein
MLIQYLLDSTYIVLEYTNTVIHTKGTKQCRHRLVDCSRVPALTAWSLHLQSYILV